MVASSRMTKARMLVLYGMAVVVFLAAIWWAVAMRPHYVQPGEGGPLPVDDTGSRIAMGALGLVVSIGLVVLARLLSPSADGEGSK